MTLLTFILSLALSFVCSTYEECQNIRSIEYFYEDRDAASTLATSTDATPDASFIDYRIREKLTFATDDGIEVVETVYDFPYLQDRYVHDWQMAVSLLARERGVEIKEYKDDMAVGYISEPVLAAYMDTFDCAGFVTNPDSFNYLDERELLEQAVRYVVLYVSFGLFFTYAKMINSCFRLFHKDKRKEV